ncbi:MAG: hypothetical protein AAGI51_06520 [Pseudomonadota bacterium]
MKLIPRLSSPGLSSLGPSTLGRRLPRPSSPRGLIPALLAAGLGLAAASAEAQVRVEFADGGPPLFSVEAPDGWVATAGRAYASAGTPRVLGLHPEEDLSLWIGMMAPPDVRSREEAEVYLREIGQRLVDDPLVEATTRMEVAGRPALRIAGRGTREEAPVDFAGFLFELPAGGWAILLFVGEYGAREVYASDIAAMRASLVVYPEEAR